MMHIDVGADSSIIAVSVSVRALALTLTSNVDEFQLR